MSDIIFFKLRMPGVFRIITFVTNIHYEARQASESHVASESGFSIRITARRRKTASSHPRARSLGLEVMARPEPHQGP